jgi:ribosomal protein L16/L10AE
MMQSGKGRPEGWFFVILSIRCRLEVSSENMIPARPDEEEKAWN